MSRIDFTPEQTTTIGVSARTSRSADTSKVSAAPRWTPPRPPVREHADPGGRGDRRRRRDRRGAVASERVRGAEIASRQLGQVGACRRGRARRWSGRSWARRPGRRSLPVRRRRRGPSPPGGWPPCGCGPAAGRGRGSCSPARRSPVRPLSASWTSSVVRTPPRMGECPHPAAPSPAGEAQATSRARSEAATGGGRCRCGRCRCGRGCRVGGARGRPVGASGRGGDR